ncbi:MAG: hypothetical protein DI544_04100 [Sphingomonas taxi]|uniref:Ice-binding protein C-terminal domain-containing protein n=1 Tax=Sphingomonas taxi TaxID=1549858 RepID=A0A2W5RES3_9SPHN|nr:MAG: hypothetical protein DI544_04100 [Sphingomonas taxi]
MKKIFAAALIAGTVVMAAPASAATNVPITETVPGYYTGTFTTSKTNTGSGTISFSDNYEFTVPTTGTVGASIISLSFDKLLTLTKVTLNGTLLTISPSAGGIIYSATGPTQLSSTNPQKLLVEGTLAPSTTGASTYTGNIAFRSAVPEPATWALMILGFGVVGYAMRRRPSVRFAQAI